MAKRKKIRLCFGSHKQRTLTTHDKNKIFERDDWTCRYCFKEAECIDHVMPYSHTFDNHPDNLAASCNFCNRVVSNKIFDTFENKRIFIIKQVSQILKNTTFKVWTVTELKELNGRLRKYVGINSIVVDTEEDVKHINKYISEEKSYFADLLEKEFNVYNIDY